MNKDRLKYYLILAFLFIGYFRGASQVNDAGLWMSAGFEKQIHKKLSVFVEQDLRMNENISEAGTIFTDLGGQYKLVKNLSFSVSYKFMLKRRVDDRYSKRHRYMLDLAYRYKFRKFMLTLRERLENQYQDYYSRPEGPVPECSVRSKLTVKYHLKKRIEPFAYAELFYLMNTKKGKIINTERFSAGFNYKLTRTSSLDVYYLINKELNVKDPITDFVMGLGYSYIL